MKQVYIVETMKKRGQAWKLRRYLFTSRTRAREEMRMCTGPLGYYAARWRPWRPLAVPMRVVR